MNSVQQLRSELVLEWCRDGSGLLGHWVLVFVPGNSGKFFRFLVSKDLDHLVEDVTSVRVFQSGSKTSLVASLARSPSY